MKRVAAFLLVFSLLFALCIFHVGADTNDFVINDGVLVKYNGSSASVTIPNSVYYIGDGAFENNKSLTSVKFHAGVKKIGSKAFNMCTSLSQISNYGSVNDVGALAFNATPYLNNNFEDYILLNNSLLKYNGAAQTVTIPSNVKQICGYAFYSNANVTSVKIGSGVYEIGECAFYNCKNLSSVSVPSNIDVIGAFAFEGTLWIKNNTNDFVICGNNILIKYKGNQRDVTIPDNVLQIGGSAFYNNTVINSIVFNSQLAIIGKMSFYGCKNLSQINLKNNVIIIDDYAFFGCSALKEFHAPQSLKNIGDNAFSNSGLSLAYLNGDNLTVGMYAFANCSSLEGVLTSQNVFAVLDYAFNGCTKLESASLSAGVGLFGENVFGSCNALTVYTPKDSTAQKYCEASKLSFTSVKGDSDLNGSVSIIDATVIQKYLAGITSFSPKQIVVSDVDYSGNLGISDATALQRVLAGL